MSGFWGLQVLPTKTYSQTVERGFRVSMAALAADAKSPEPSSLLVRYNDSNYVLCTLNHGKVNQQPLDILFDVGEDITFSVTGKNAIHLTGNYIPEEDLDDFDDYDHEDIDSDEFDDGKIEELVDEEEEEEEEEEIDDEEVPQAVPITQTKPTKRPQQDGKAEPPNKKAKAEHNETKAAEKKPEPKAEKKTEPKAAEKKPAEPKKAEPKGEPLENKKLPNGLVIEDKKAGQGAKAKPGKKVSMRYIGRLMNGKVFDKNVSGKPFSFNLGRGEVIKGWDMGIVGMKEGGERKLVIPAALAYGSRGAPPDIPKNATLEFEVKLLNVK